MPRSRLLFSALALPLAAAIPLSAAAAQSPTAGTTTAPVVSMSVTETVQAAPDMATINTGVETQAMTAKAAMADNAARIDKLIKALRANGIASKDIQTSGINLSPRYDYSNRKDGEGPRFLGYQANNNLDVTLHDLSAAGTIVDAMVNAGATNINGPSFGIADMHKLKEEARTKALKTARERADFYAAATGYGHARLIAISETGQMARPVPMRAMEVAMAAPAPKTQIEPGQLSTSLTLEFKYALEK